MQEYRNIELEGKHGKPVLVDVFFNDRIKYQPIVIFSHGFKGFKDWGTFDLIARKFAAEGFIFFKFNFSYNGATPQNPEETHDLEAFANNNFLKEMDDLGTVIDFAGTTNLIPEEQIDRSKIYLLGHSRGGGISILRAAEDDRVQKMVTWSAVNDFESRWSRKQLKDWKEKGVIYIPNGRTGEEMPMYYQMVEDFYNNKSRLEIPAKVKMLGIPFMVIHGTEDESVPQEQALEMKKWNPNITLELIPGAGHTFGGKHPYHDSNLPRDLEKVVNQTVAFFKKK